MQPRIIKRMQVQGGESCQPAISSHGARTAPRKQARLVEHAGEVRAIEFTCSCGAVTLVELTFDAPAKSTDTKNTEKRS